MVRVLVLADPDVFLVVAAAVLLPVGLWLAAVGPSRSAGTSAASPRPLSLTALFALAFATGAVGGV